MSGFSPTKIVKKKLSDYTLEELYWCIDNEPGTGANHQAAAHELQRRKLDGVHASLKRLEKPHWSVTPNFWLTFVAAVAGILAVWFAYRAEIRELRADHKLQTSTPAPEPQKPKP